MLERPFRYIEDVPKAHRKVSRGFLKRFQLKKWSFVRIFQPHLELNFLKSQLFSLFLTYRRIEVLCDHKFLLTQSCIWGRSFRYLDCVRKVRRKIYRSLWRKSFKSKHEVLLESSRPILSFISSKSFFFYFSWHIVWLMYHTGMVTFF